MTIGIEDGVIRSRDLASDVADNQTMPRFRGLHAAQRLDIADTVSKVTVLLTAAVHYHVLTAAINDPAQRSGEKAHSSEFAGHAQDI